MKGILPSLLIGVTGSIFLAGCQTTQPPSQAELAYQAQQAAAAQQTIYNVQSAKRAYQAKEAAAKARRERQNKAAADAKARRRAQAWQQEQARKAEMAKYEKRLRELELQSRELDLQLKRAQVENASALEKARMQNAQTQADLEIERLKVEIEKLRQP